MVIIYELRTICASYKRKCDLSNSLVLSYIILRKYTTPMCVIKMKRISKLRLTSILVYLAYNLYNCQKRWYNNIDYMSFYNTTFEEGGCMRVRYKNRRRENRTLKLLVTAAIALLVIVVSVRAVTLWEKLKKNQVEISNLQQQIEEQKTRSKEIEDFAKETQTRKYIEQIAREKLGLVYPGEIIFEKKDTKK